MSDIPGAVVTKDGNVLKIELPARLDGKNAPQISEEIGRFTSPDLERIVFDAREMRYISADGLDVILGLKLKYRNVFVENARMGICDTLEAFGFNNFVEITKQYRFVSVKGAKVIGQGGHGAIYKTEDDIIIKVYKDGSSLDVIENERRFARNAFKNGISTAIAYDVVETEYGYGVMFEMLNGTTLGKFLAKHPEKLDEYSVRFADLLKKLNTTEADPELYPDFHDVYIDRMEAVHAMGFITEEQTEALKRIIRSIPHGNGMIHGDFHPNNVMIDEGGELMLIDMADISRGNGFFDIGGTFLIMNFIPGIPALRYLTKRITSMGPVACRKMWKIFMRRYYGTEDEKTLDAYTRQFKAFSRVRIAGSLGMPSNRPGIIDKAIALFIKKMVVPKADEYEKLFSSSPDN